MNVRDLDPGLYLDPPLFNDRNQGIEMMKNRISISNDSPGELLDPHAVPNAVVELVRSAKEWLVLISPYFKPWRHLRDALEDAHRAGVTVRFLIRTDQVPRARGLFRTLNIEPMALTRLHSKIYISDQQALLTSMNLYDASRESLEFGLQIERDKQTQLHNKITTQAQQLFQKAEPVILKPLAKAPTSPESPSTDSSSKTPAPKKNEKSARSKSSSGKSLTRSQQKSFDLWKEGMAIPDIAKKRDLKPNTIFSHLAAAIELRWARVEDVVEEERRAAISEAVGKIGPDASTIALAKTSRGYVRFGEVECVLAAMKALRD